MNYPETPKTMIEIPRTYIAIDLKSFFASVECVRRKLDPLTTHLVVADLSRTEKTICLAVTPALKSYGIPGRPRLFEVIEKVKVINAERKLNAPRHTLSGETSDDLLLQKSPNMALSYIVAAPHMADYIQTSLLINAIYFKHVSPQDVHIYSIDEVFIDVTNYLHTYKVTARALAEKIVNEVLETTGITATVGIGSNLYLAKVAMDILAKKAQPDAHGVRIAELNEMSYRRALWTHRPIRDFWRVGRGYSKKLEGHGLYTMGDIARASLSTYGETLLYKLFGINAELLIDHAWGYEPCTIDEIKAYKPSSRSLTHRQVLPRAYSADEAELIVSEMADELAMELVAKAHMSDQIVLTVGFANGGGTHGTANLRRQTSASSVFMNTARALFQKLIASAYGNETDNDIKIKLIGIAAMRLISEDKARASNLQFGLFNSEEDDTVSLSREKRAQLAMLKIRGKYGKNAILRGINFEDAATTVERNGQIGGHKR